MTGDCVYTVEVASSLVFHSRCCVLQHRTERMIASSRPQGLVSEEPTCLDPGTCNDLRTRPFPIRSIRKLKTRKLRISESTILGNASWTYEFHPL